MTDVTESGERSGHRAAMLLIVAGGGLLMHHRDDKPGIAHPGCWAGFGGAVEPGETVVEALHREVAEETGLTISDPVFLTEAVDREGDGRLVSLFYVRGDYRPGDIDLREGAGVAVHQVADLPGLTITPFVRRAIESHLVPALVSGLAAVRRPAEGHTSTGVDSTTDRNGPNAAAGQAGGPTIRDARPADAAQIALVHVRSWQEAYRGLLPQGYLDGLDPVQRAARWEGWLSGARAGAGADGGAADGAGPGGSGVLVAEAGGTILGFVAYCPSRDEDIVPGEAGEAGEVGEVSAIYLLPGAWGRGVGRRLMDAVLARLAGAKFQVATLWVLESNERARRFYAVAGWSPDGARKVEEDLGFPASEVRYRRSLP